MNTSHGHIALLALHLFFLSFFASIGHDVAAVLNLLAAGYNLAVIRWLHERSARITNRVMGR